jgi:TatD DNase family protein
MQLVDTHVHISFDSFADDLDEIALSWRQSGIVRLVHSCVEPGEFPAMQAIADRFPEVYLAVGIHPLDMDKWEPTTAEHIMALAQSDSRVVAIGETGLDFYKAQDAEVQRQAFWAQLTIAQALQLPVIIHCRDAAMATADLIRKFQQEHGFVTGVMHCWAGTPEETQWFLDLGFYVSFSGIVTFKNARQVQASAKVVPTNRLLIETDCPFLSPEPRRKERRNQPAFVKHVADFLAELRQVPSAELAQTTTHNACQLFRLPPPDVAAGANSQAISVSGQASSSYP